MNDAKPHLADETSANLSSRLNWLRAGVLGANDGIVSTAGIVVGVVGATTDRAALISAGVAGLAAGAMSMAVGEYVSVSTQRDTEQAALAIERRELDEQPTEELEELVGLLRGKGIEAHLAEEVATQLTTQDALAAHADLELGIDKDALTSPWQAAAASFISFTIGALVPLLAVLLSPVVIAIPVTVAAVVLALGLTGSVSARLGNAPWLRATIRNVAGGLLAMGVTYWIGRLVGTQIT